MPKVFPTINLNGSDPVNMVADYRVAIDHANRLAAAFATITPHGRDYQTMPAGSIEAARDEHFKHLGNINEAINYLNEIAINILNQTK